ncbi:MAG: tetratricopeptide repeat protein [Candidatus Thermoplasmatota archaeon]|nr:tetratricopeptide repeat protein [Candidatus Thermoplasmatota archaeon]
MVDMDGDDTGVVKAFRNALRKAWEDGRISYDERNIITQFSDGLPISQEKISELEAREYLRYRWREYETTPYDQQLSLIEKGIVIDQENDFLWMKKGSLQYLMGDVEGALGSLERSLELDPLSEEAWFWKGIAYTTHGDPEAATDCFERAVEEDPDQTLSWVMLSRLERRQGNLEKSRACATRAIESFPEHPVGFIERALTHLSMVRPDDAENDVKMALERDPNSGKALEIKARIDEGVKAPVVQEDVPPPQVTKTERKDGKKRPKVKVEVQPEEAVTEAPPIAPVTSVRAAEEPLVPSKTTDEVANGPASSVSDNVVVDVKEASKPVRSKAGPSYLDEDMFDEGPPKTVPGSQGKPANGPEEEGTEEVLMEEEEVEEEPVEIVYKVIPCPKCGSGVPITTEERPIVVICPTCGAKGRIIK